MAFFPCKVVRLTYLKYVLITLCAWTIAALCVYAMFRNRRVTTVLWIQSNEVEVPKVKQECIHPLLLMNDSVMVRLLKKIPPETCPGDEEWVYVDNGTVRFSKLAAHTPGLTCNYVPLLRKGDYAIMWGKPVLNIRDGFRIPWDFFRVYCSTTDRRVYNGLFAGVAYTQDRAGRPEADMSEGFGGMSIAILGFDSMSRMSWLRRLVETRKYFHDELGAIELEEHNILGDGTTAVLFPMLTGKFEWELPEARRYFRNATTMDKFPFLWNELKPMGYLTSWCNADNMSAPFNWRMLGFHDQPTDFYTRPFFQVARPYYLPKNKSRKTWAKKKFCVGSRPYSQVWLNYFRDIFVMYPNKRKFLLHFLVDLSHDDNNLITMMDLDIRNLVKYLYDNGYLNNTLLILMGDHGARYDKARYTWSGKMEERLPYFSMLFPKWFLEKYPEAIRNVRTNAKRLTTPFDLYETFRDFIKFNGTGKGDIRQRGISLFKEIPPERSCENAGIAPHWCACLASRNVSLDEDRYARKALEVAVETINYFTEEYRDLCAKLVVSKVTDVIRLETRTDVLRFTKTDNIGGIYNITFGAKNRNPMNVYQLTFSTVPGAALFEVTVTHDILRNKLMLSEKEISRINKYGDDPHCILDKNRQLRQFCYCNKRLKPWRLF